MPTPEEILTDLNTNILPAVADLTNSVQTAITAMNALRDKAAVQTDKADELLSLTPADVTLPNGDIVPNFAKVRSDLNAAITAFTSVVYLEATATAVDSAKLEGKTLLEISTAIKADIVGGAPAIHDTLKEVSDALSDDDTAINALLTQLSTLSNDLSTLATALDDKAAAVHEHDSRYYTKTEVDASISTLSNDLSTLETALDDKAAAVHEHDSRYYTKSQTDTAIGNATSRPTFTTDAVTNISGTSATLNGTISDFVDASSSLQYRFIYGSTTAMEEGATTWTTVSTIGAVSARVTVALRTTTYYVLMQIRDMNKPDSMGILPISADWAAERTSFLSGSEILDSDTSIHIEGTGGTGYIAMDTTNVPSLTNASVVSNEILATGNYKAISKPFDQEGGQGDFTAITPTTKIKANKLTVDGTSTASAPVFTSGYDNLLSTGSKIIVDDGGEIKEVVAGTVSKTVIGTFHTYEYPLNFSGKKAEYLLSNNANDTTGVYNCTTSGTLTYEGGGVSGKQDYSR